MVDGIWATPGIRAKQGGYLEPGDFLGDHSLLWIDLSYDNALGHNPPDPVSPELDVYGWTIQEPNNDTSGNMNS